MLLRASLGPVVHDDVDRSRVSELLDHLSPNGVCLLLERLDLDYDQCYIQVCCLGGRWALEHRDGDAEHHYRAESTDRSVALDVLMGWAERRDGWADALEWRPLVLQPVAPAHSDPGPNDWTHQAGTLPG